MTEQAKIAEVETDRARQMVADELGSRERELADLKQMLATNADKLAVAQAAHAETLRKQRELNDAARELELTVEKRVRQELAAVHERAKIDAEDDLKAKVSEKEAQIAAMQRRIEDLRRKADQGSQQLQGEAHHPLGVQENQELERQLAPETPGRSARRTGRCGGHRFDCVAGRV